MAQNIHKNEIDKNLDDFSYEYVDFINSETQKMGNRVIWISLVIILLTLNIISLTEIEVNGLKVAINTNFLIPILIVINLYFYLQFYFLIKLDNLKFKIPNQISQIISSSQSEFETIEALLNSSKLELENLNLKIEILKDSDIPEELKIKQKELLDLEHLDIENRLNSNSAKLDAFWQSIQQSKEKFKKGINFMKYNRILNDIFPKIIFFSSIILFVLSIINSYCR